jgi:DNA topoisomerase-2
MKKLTGGRNGYSVKLTNTQQKYKQNWTNNMGVCGKAKITKNTKGDEYTCIIFKPDLKRFGMDSINEDTTSLL